MSSKIPLLLHVCCAPCGGGCIAHPKLDEFDCEIKMLYFSNSNLNTFEEYERRLFHVRRLGEYFNIHVEADPYDHAAWQKAVSGFESAPEGGDRCRRCFAYSLGRAAQRAAQKNYRFATSLTVSPRKSSSVIFETAAVFEHFIPLDFKKQNGYLQSTKVAKELDFYRQSYCGCEFSLSERHSASSREITPPPSSAPDKS